MNKFERYFRSKLMVPVTALTAFLILGASLVSCSKEESSSTSPSTGFRATVNGSKF